MQILILPENEQHDTFLEIESESLLFLNNNPLIEESIESFVYFYLRAQGYKAAKVLNSMVNMSSTNGETPIQFTILVDAKKDGKPVVIEEMFLICAENHLRKK